MKRMDAEVRYGLAGDAFAILEPAEDGDLVWHDEAHARIAALESDLRAAIDDRDRLAVDNARHAADFERMTDRIVELRRLEDAWQTATGLVGGCGDPSDLEPRHLEQYIGQLVRVADAARALVGADGMESETASEFIVLRELVRALPQEAA